MLRKGLARTYYSTLTKGEKEGQKSYAQMANSHKAKIALANTWEVRNSNQKQKDAQHSSPKLEPEKKRVVFRKRSHLFQSSEADLMFIGNSVRTTLTLPFGT